MNIVAWIGRPRKMAAHLRDSKRPARGPGAAGCWVTTLLVAASMLLLPAALGQSNAHGSVSIEVSLAWLAQHASAVVIGTPEDGYCDWEPGENGGPNRIVTYRRLRVQQVLGGGTVGSEIWVRMLGGTVGTTGARVEGEVTLTQGKRVLLFVVWRPDGTASVLAMAQGAYWVTRDADGIDRLRAMQSRGLVVTAGPKPGAAALLAGSTLQEAERLISAARSSHAQ